MKILRNNIQLIDIGFIPDKSAHRQELMVENCITLDFELADYLKLEKVDKVVYNNTSFFLNKDYVPTINSSTGGYKYDLTFYDITERFKDFKLKYSLQGVDELDFKLTTSGDKFLDVIIYSLQKHGLGAFVKGQFPTEIKEIHFQNVDVFSGLNLIAETYKLEWWIDGNTFNLGKCEFGTHVLLEYDKALDDISFSNSSEKLITRLYPFGSTRNLPTNYRTNSGAVDDIAERRLRLPAGTDYVDLFPNLPENQIIEGVQVFEEVYPRQKNKIVEVATHVQQGNGTDAQNTTIFTIKGDNTFTITQADIIAGQPLKIAFQTGYLAGREFELIIKGDNKFEIKYTQEGRVYIPNTTLKPQIGDEFFFFNFKADAVFPTLIPLAENELFTESRKFLDKLGHEFVYDVKTRSIYCEENNIDLQVGQKVTLKSPTLGIINSRIRKFEKSIYNKFECDYQIGDSAEYSRLGNIDKKADDTKKELKNVERKTYQIEQFSERQWRDAKETMELLSKSIQGFSNSINPITVNAMSLLVGDESLQFRFVGSKTTPARVQHLIQYNKDSKQITAAQGILQHMTLGIKTLSNSHKPNEYRFWDISAYTSLPLSADEKTFFLYAKCAKVGTTGAFVLSETAIAMEAEANYYHFLVGILNSDNGGERSFAPLYGFSEILPGRVTTDKIVSQDGKTYFDLLQGIIGGHIKFVSTSGETDLGTWAQGTSQDIQNAQDAANEADRKARQAILDASNAVTDYNAKFAAQQQQIDGVVDNWFYSYSPTLANYPASEWTTNEIKDRHIGDTFTNTAQSPATDAGKSWRFVKNSGVYSWTQIADSDAVLALQKAAQAQATADGKSSTYLVQPTSYHLGDTWVLNADRTINGISYKSGEILTATQDSNSFVEAHWIKRVRYTDDSAVENLQIGTENLLSNSDTVFERAKNANKNYRLIDYPSSKTLGKGKYTVVFKAKFSPNAQGAWLAPHFGGYNSIGKYILSEFDGIYVAQGENIHEQQSIAFFQGNAENNEHLGSYVKIDWVCLYEGWVKPPLTHVKSKAEVAAAIADAKKAGTDAQNAANTANQAVGNLNTYVDGAFKDGVIDSSEAKAIEKYINIVNSEKAGLEATYNKLYVNSYLEGAPKTALLNAKVSYFGAVDALLSAINTAIADGKTTVAEKQTVDARYSDYKTSLAALQSSIEEANRAIQAKLDSLSTDKINAIDIGDRNLLLKSGNKITNSLYPTAIYSISETGRNLQQGEEVTVVIKASLGAGKSHFGLFNSGGPVLLGIVSPSEFVNGIAVKKILWVKEHPTYPAGNLAVNVYPMPYTSTSESTIEWIKIVRGNKASKEWTEAPEDIQARIDLEKARINEILSDDIADPSEKQYLNNLWNEIYAEYPRYWAQANDYGVDKSNYETKYSALNGLLAPVLANLNVNTNVSGASIRSAFSGYYDARAVLSNAITKKAEGNAKLHASIIAMSQGGKMLYKDPTFKSTDNSTARYNNSGGTSTTWERIPKPADAPSDSTHIMRYTYNGAPSSPGCGGFYFGNQSRANAVFLTKIIAKIPIGQVIEWASNNIGDEGDKEWLTSQSGTGKYETYLCRVTCGATGTFSTTNYFYFSIGTNEAFTVDVAYATVYDLTLFDNTAEAALQAAKEQAYLKEAFAQVAEVKGGLIMGATLAVRDAANKVRAYINGLSSKAYALATGVENFASTDPSKPEKQKSWLDHLGNAKFGNLRIGVDGDGSVRIEDADNVIRVELSVKDIPTLDGLTEDSETVREASNAYVNFTGDTYEVILPNAIEVPKNYSELIISGTVSAEAMAGGENSLCSVSIVVSLITQSGEVYAQLATVFATSSREPRVPYENLDTPIDGLSTHDIQQQNIDTKLMNVPIGFYRIKATYHKVARGQGAWGSGGIGATYMKSLYRNDNRQIVIGKDGISAFFNKDKYVHIQNLNGVPMLEVGGGIRVKGDVRMRGVPVEIAQIGYWGSIAYSMSGICQSCTRTNQGRYRVNLRSGSFGSANAFIPEVTSHAGGDTPHYAQIIGWDYYYIDVITADDNSANDGGFMIKIYER